MTHSNSNLADILASNEAVFNWCLRLAEQAYRQGKHETAAEWCSLAGYSAAFSGWFGDLSSPALESLLLKLGATLPAIPKQPAKSNKQRWLHVMTTAVEIGGHTNLVCRWMGNDEGQGCHSVVITDQTVPFPNKLRACAEATGGEVILMDRKLTLLARALELRKIAASMADVVVLHLHPHDVASVIAFAVPGDIPVCLMNHMDHMFWIGSSVTDVVIEFRDLGKSWTQQYRGVNRSVVLPLPLEIPQSRPPNGRCAATRQAARNKLAISPTAVVLLTIATAYKYRTVGPWNFLETARTIMEQCPEAMLLAVGPASSDFDNMWGKNVWRTGNRIQAVGCQSDLTDYYAAADIALGSFPFASQTAMLECGLQGMPCVPTPAAIRFGFDDIAFEVARCPVSREDYIQEVIRLVQDSQLREISGRDLASSIKAHHCGSGWLTYLDQLRSAMPAAHQLYPPQPGRRLEPDALEFWGEFCGLHRHQALAVLHGRIIGEGAKVTPVHDAELMRRLTGYQSNSMAADFCFWFRNARFKLGRLRRNLLLQK